MYVEPFQRSIVTSYSTCHGTFWGGAGGVNVPGVMDARLTKSMIIQLNVGIF